jgi:hypothetical protein
LINGVGWQSLITFGALLLSILPLPLALSSRQRSSHCRR